MLLYHRYNTSAKIVMTDDGKREEMICSTGKMTR
jgi:hypothetical protein